jgi:hypothetical protein
MSSLRQRRPRRESAKHLEFIRTLPCVLTGTNFMVEAAHIRYEDARVGKRATGMGEKPSDIWTIPLSAGKHRTDQDAQHAGAEREFWQRHGIDPCVIALALWAHTGDSETCESILMSARRLAISSGHIAPTVQFNGASHR